MPIAGGVCTSTALCSINRSASATLTCAILGCRGMLAPLMEAIGWHMGCGGGKLGCSFLCLSLSINLHHGNKSVLYTEQQIMAARACFTLGSTTLACKQLWL